MYLESFKYIEGKHYVVLVEGLCMPGDETHLKT